MVTRVLDYSNNPCYKLTVLGTIKRRDLIVAERVVDVQWYSVQVQRSAAGSLLVHYTVQYSTLSTACGSQFPQFFNSAMLIGHYALLPTILLGVPLWLVAAHKLRHDTPATWQPWYSRPPL